MVRANILYHPYIMGDSHSGFKTTWCAHHSSTQISSIQTINYSGAKGGGVVELHATAYLPKLSFISHCGTHQTKHGLISVQHVASLTLWRHANGPLSLVNDTWHVTRDRVLCNCDFPLAPVGALEFELNLSTQVAAPRLGAFVWIS